MACQQEVGSAGIFYKDNELGGSCFLRSFNA
jgi:hypothetical protein